MDKTSKVILGQSSIKKFMPFSGKIYSVVEKHQIIKDYLSSGCSKRDILEKYTGQPEEYGQLPRWMRQLGYDSPPIVRKTNFAISNKTRMQKTEKPALNSE